MSEDCHQEVAHNCSVSQLSNYAWWTGRDEKIYQYWHGDQDVNVLGKKMLYYLKTYYISQVANVFLLIPATIITTKTIFVIVMNEVIKIRIAEYFKIKTNYL